MQIYKLSKNITIVLPLFVIIWVLPIFLKYFSYINFANQFCEFFELFLHALMLAILIRIYNRNDFNDSKLAVYFLLVNVFLLINDVVFYIMVFLKHSTPILHFPLILFFVKYMPSFTWMLALILYLFRILTIHSCSVKKLLIKQFYFIIFDILVVFLFVSHLHYAYGMFYWQNIIHFMIFIVQCIIVNLLILLLIYSNNIGMVFFALGFIILISGNFLVLYSFISLNPSFLSIGDLIWCLGMIFICVGYLCIYSNNDYCISNWLGNEDMIKSKLSFWTFSISSCSFILFFVFSHFFITDFKAMYIGLPFFIILYSSLVIILSIRLGRYIEIFFKTIAINFESIIIRGKNSPVLNAFAIREFAVLQDHIMNTVQIKEDRDKIAKQLGTIAARVAHDIGSPIYAMNIVVNNLKKSEVNMKDIVLLENSIKNIQSIANNLLAQFRNENSSNISSTLDDGNTPRFIDLIEVLKEVVADKNLEWSDKPYSCEMINNFESINKPVWIHTSPVSIKRALSNLLNNAYESLVGPNKQISIRVNYIDIIELEVKDSGCGIPLNRINNVLNGESSKHSGKGIGLASAKEFFAGLNGVLLLSSIVGIGTTIRVQIPINIPNWFCDEIYYFANQTFVVLDDDPSIHILWRQKFIEYNIKSRHFTTVREFNLWYSTATREERVLYLFDNELGDQTFTGLKLIESGVKDNVYLVTNSASDFFVQRQVEKLGARLIPKYHILGIKLIYAS